MSQLRRIAPALLPALLLACTDSSKPGSALRPDAPAAEPTPASPAAATPAGAKPTEAKAGIVASEVRPADLPRNLPLQGRVVVARRWTDRLGDNLLVLTETPPAERCDDDGMCYTTLETYGYHYLLSGGAQTLLWRTSDAVRDCELDMTLAVHPGSVTVTDLDGDGTAETAFAYAMACRGDVSPYDMKLLMHEGAAKFALRGHTTAPGGENEPDAYPSEMTVDPAFNRAPPEFLRYATEQWRRYERYSAWGNQ